MGTLDPVLVDIATQVGISATKTASLLSSLLSGIAEAPGGMPAFLDRFRSAGFSDLVGSWLGGASTQPLSSSSLESAVGHDWIEKAASNAGLSFSTAASALTFMLPGLIQRLTPGGVVPTRIPADILAYIRRPNPAATVNPRKASRAAERRAKEAGAPLWLWPVLALLVLVLLGYWFWTVRHAAKTTQGDEEFTLRAAKRAGERNRPNGNLSVGPSGDLFFPRC
jgi:uncharacterized protein YidB (DUF937 family)